MKNLNESTVLDFYIGEIKKDNIAFLKGKTSYKNKIEEQILNLRNAAGMNSKIKAAKELWKLLFETAMSSIDPDKRGYNKLFDYFDEYVDFEELIFASDSFYRDHTLHCLWVYFLGEYIMRQKEFEWIIKNMNAIPDNYLDQIEVMKSLQMDDIFGEVIKLYEKAINMFKNGDSIRCVAALTHDLGYPLKKIEKVNKSIKGILPYFSINNFNEFNFNYSEIQQNFISSFIEFLTIDVQSEVKTEGNIELLLKVFETNENGRVEKLNREKILALSDKELNQLKEMLKLYPMVQKDMSKFWTYSSDFEEYKHGIMSAYLLIKNVKAFNKITFKCSEKMDFTDVDIEDIAAKQSILKAVTNHTSEGFQISDISSYSSFLTFIDEIEEFSRISRANQNREYVTEFCSTAIYMNEGYTNIDFIFDNNRIDNLNPEIAFKGRCERFLSVFDIPNLSKSLKIRLRCIGKLNWNKNVYELEIARKYAKISINGEEKCIPEYLNSKQLYTREEYEDL